MIIENKDIFLKDYITSILFYDNNCYLFFLVYKFNITYNMNENNFVIISFYY